MKRSDFIHLIENCETFDCIDCINDITGLYDWNDVKNLLKINDPELDAWISSVVLRIEKLKEFYLNNEGNYGDSVEFEESNLMDDLRDYLGKVDELLTKHEKFVFEGR